MTEIFVFGSNLAGQHGKGAALFAVKNHGAVYGNPVGIQGNSYAIPTKDANFQTLTLPIINAYVLKFLDFADENPELLFNVTAIGCGLAGLKPEQIAPMFRHYPPNVVLPKEFKDVLGINTKERVSLDDYFKT